jgi:hypothetical protein
MEIEVSDLFDSFHEVAVLIWQRFLFRGGVPSDQPHFDGVTRAIEVDVFFAACSRRVAEATGVTIAHENLDEFLRLHDGDGKVLEGIAAEYHTCGFDWGSPDSDTITNQVLGGDLRERSRADVRLFVHIPTDAEQIVGRERR